MEPPVGSGYPASSLRTQTRPYGDDDDDDDGDDDDDDVDDEDDDDDGGGDAGGDYDHYCYDCRYWL